MRDGNRVFESTYWTKRRGAEVVNYSYALMDLTVFGGQKAWENSPEGSEIVGLLVLDDAWLDQLYVDPAWTGRGLGSTLLEFAKAARPDGLDLWTFQANEGARRFYERRGFVAVSETDGENEEDAREVRYHWSAE